MRTPFIIYRNSPGEGLFSNAFCVLDNIAYARLFGWIPLVDMQRHKTRYSSPEIRNDWDIFFLQPFSSGYQLDDALKHPHRDNGSRSNGLFTGIANGPLPTGLALTFYRGLFRRWIRIRENIVEDGESKLRKLALNPLDYVSVHYRGTDMIHTPGHQVSAPIGDYIKLVIAARSRLGLQKVFLATDDMSAVSLFSEAFGNDLVMCDIERSSDGRALHYASSGYELGNNVIVDALILSKAAHLVAGRSNVAIAALLLGSRELEISEVSPKSIYERSRRPHQRKYLVLPRRICTFAVRSVIVFLTQRHWRKRTIPGVITK